MVAELWTSIVALHETLRPSFFDAIYITAFTIAGYFLYIVAVLSALISTLLFYRIVRKTIPVKEYQLADKDAPTVTVHIPTKDDLVAINCAERCLESDYPKHKYKIFIGDDSTDTAVSKVLRNFAKQHKQVSIFKRKDNRGYKAGNLNNLLKHTTSECIVVFDSDYLPEKDFLRRVVAPMVVDKKCAGVQATWAYLDSNKNQNSALGVAIPAQYQKVVFELTQGRNRFATFCGSAQAIRTSALKEEEGWYEDMGEDVELSLRFMKRGYRIVYLPQLKCLSEVPFRLRDGCAQQKRWSYGLTMSLIKNKDFFFNKNVRFSHKLSISYVFVAYFFLLCTAASFILSTIATITVPSLNQFNLTHLAVISAQVTLITLGFFGTGLYSLLRTDSTRIADYVISLFLVGPFFLYVVLKGVFQAIFGRKFEWATMQKVGEKQRITALRKATSGNA